MIAWKRVLPVAALLLSASVGAQADTIYTFDSVTGIGHRQSNLDLTGVLINNTAPTTVTVPAQLAGGHFERCVTFFNLMLTNPGTYRLTVVTESHVDPSLGITVTNFVRCGLERP